MKLTLMKCPACGASVNADTSNNSFKCDYCGNTVSIIKPIEISNSIYEGFNEVETNKLKNYVEILHQSMLAGNYAEAYSYCNKALEVNPKSAEVWENKAICSFWLSSINKLEQDKVNEILTYLNASKNLNPESKTYITTCKDIGNNLYYVIMYIYNGLSPDITIRPNVVGYSFESESKVLNLINLLEICYELDPDVLYLKEALKILTKGKINWLRVTRAGKMESYLNSISANNHKFDASKKKELLENKITSLDPNYVESEKEKERIRRKSAKSSQNAVLLVVLIIMVLMILIGIFSKI
jgi:tetratricopeptide (TPR) repeat protein